MWLLSTDRAELHHFLSPETIPDGYAILSHVWGQTEQTFQDTQRLHAASKADGSNPRDHASAKVRESCILAERHGYKWIWNDTCCIDKTSSAELEEAINSMFRYYTLSEVCYAYLRDVPAPPPRPASSPSRSPATDVDSESLDAPGSAFRKSRWHTRGWTLQELIAPSLVIFLSTDWDVLGTKAGLAPLLEAVTGVPAAVLRKEEDTMDMSVAQRMAWAATRQTTRVEDEAYCLMGLFGIHMSTLYGEGRQAFRRLQEEIMRRSVDTSLFAWGIGTSVIEFDVSTPMGALGRCEHGRHASFLLASAPSDFAASGGVTFRPPPPPAVPSIWDAVKRVPPRLGQQNTTRVVQAQGIGLPSFTITPYGVRARVPTFSFMLGTDNVLIVLLPFTTLVDDANPHATFGLILSPCYEASDPLQPLYHTAAFLRSSSASMSNNDHFRIVRIHVDSDGLLVHASRRTYIRPEWQELYIAHTPPPKHTVVPTIRMNADMGAPFRFSRTAIQVICTQYRLVEERVVVDAETGNDTFVMRIVFREEREERPVHMVLYLGRCAATVGSDGDSDISSDHYGSESGGRGVHWAKVVWRADELSQAEETCAHACAEDHICDWPGLTKAFSGMEDTVCVRRMTLSFAWWGVNPTGTLIVNAVNMS